MGAQVFEDAPAVTNFMDELRSRLADPRDERQAARLSIRLSRRRAGVGQRLRHDVEYSPISLE
jgi:hypothetical protein